MAAAAVIKDTMASTQKYIFLVLIMTIYGTQVNRKWTRSELEVNLMGTGRVSIQYSVVFDES